MKYHTTPHGLDLFVFVVDNIFLMDALLKPWLIKLMPNSILIQQFFTLLPKCALHFIPCKKHVSLVKVFMQVILMVKKYFKYSSSWTLSLSHTHIHVCMYVCRYVCGTCMYVCMYVFNRYYGKWWHAMNLVNAPPTRVMKIIFHIHDFFLIFNFLNLKERSLKVLNFKKHGLEHCYNSLRLFPKILFHIILIKTTCFNFLLLSQLEVTLLGVIFPPQFGGHFQKNGMLVQMAFSKIEKSIFQNAHIFLFYFIFLIKRI